MADFRLALRKILENEGGYVDDPDDQGGETYMGISRRHHPKWEGWERIDQYKKSTRFPEVLDVDAVIRQWVRDFYHDLYWNPIGLSKVASQDAAEELLDMAVHLGVKRAVIFLQRGLNVLNRRGRLWNDLVVDGSAGLRTRTALSKYEAMEAPGFLVKVLLLQRGGYYIDRALDREVNEKYIRGWLRRLNLR